MGNHTQSGVALVSILLVVAIATVMAVTMVREQQATIQTTRSFLSRGQAAQYALGGEELARQILYEDFAEGNGLDRLTDTWADPELHFEFEEGEVNLQITDLQGLLNVNSLAASNAKNQIFRQRLVNLLNANGIDPILADRIQDWIDADNSIRPAGAEDFEYLAMDPPYRAANNTMQVADELILTGVPVEEYREIFPWVAALPVTDAWININTAPPVVLQALTPQLSFEAAQTLAQVRDEQEGFETVEAFLQSPQLAGLGVVGDGLGVQSMFFEVRVIARYQDRFSYLTSIVQRQTTTGAMHVIYRDYSKSFRPRSVVEEDTDRG